MKRIVGAGGWAYFNVPGDHLFWYSKAFNIVEVNSTFYEFPDLRQVKNWRKKVHDNFVFTVRCNRKLTHSIGLKPVEKAYAIFEKMKSLCEVLKADLLHIQTSRKSDINLTDVQNFLASINRNGIALVWEIRGEKTMDHSLRNKLYRILQENGVIHCVDLSKEDPAFVNENIAYTRLFGSGTHNLWQFTDDEIKKIDNRLANQNSKTAVIISHTKKMFLDAARLKKYMENGTFLKTTKNVGIDAVIEVLREDAFFPCTKNQLLSHQGWKIVDITFDKRERLYNLLKKIPNTTYDNIFMVQKQLDTLHEKNLL